MTVMTAGITKAGEGIDGISWNILGQTYVPKQHSETSFSWHATLPSGTMVPPHIMPGFTTSFRSFVKDGAMAAISSPAASSRCWRSQER